MIYNDYDYNPFLDEIGFLGPFFVIVAYIGNLFIYVYNMVYEKQTKVKEGMKIMGLTDGIYFLSYFIRYIIISFVDSLIIACIFLLLFTKIPFIINFLMIFLFSINIFSLAFCFQSFIDKAKESLLLSLIIYFTMFFFYLLVMNDNVSYNMKLGFSIFPQVVIFMVFNLLGKFESNSRQFYFKDISYIYTNYSILIMFIALIIDNFIYLFIGYYLQNILKHEFDIRKPWYFLFTPKYWGCKKRKKNLINQNILILEDKDEILIDNNENFQNEDIYKEMIEPKNSLKIKNIYKQFDDGKIAVNRISLNLYKNEIFALLGHNGAGKTTLISMLIGLYEATDGEVIYNNMNILLPENISEFRKKLGICPQHDVLFKDLNVREHLEMFSVFKGVPQENIESEINKIIKDFQLEDIQYTLAKNLSGGQRRKLSIGISLIGGSEIIFLDEPSSSIDTISKRNLWKILKKQCDNKIIILTTHNMEEASILGK
jgi:ATP-binding cassette subfamily A (ABC1) protein 3